MINRLIDVALKNRFIVVVAVPRPRRLGMVGADVHADRRDSRSLRQPGDRLHGLARAQPAGGRGPGHVPAHDEPSGARRRTGGPVAIGVRLLDDLRGLRGQRGAVLRADSRPRTHEPRHEEPARGRHADARTDATGVGHVFWYTVESPTHVTPRAPHPAGLVHPLPAQCRAGRRGGGLRRWPCPAVPDRRRSEPPAGPTTCR